MRFQKPSAPISTFDAVELPSVYREAMARLGIERPTPVQALALPTALEGRDLIGVAQTGSGKTLAFALSILSMFEKRPKSRALILVPSREMALQIHRVFESLWTEAPHSSCVVIGGLPGNKQNSQMKKHPRLVIATPGRLNDLLRDNKLLLQGVEMVVVDEADRMLDLGFVPQLRDIQATLRGERQTQMYSASFGHQVEAVAEILMRQDVAMVRTAQAEKPVESLTQRVLFMAPGMKNDRLQDELNAVKGSAIVFAASQESCARVGDYLKEYGHSVEYVHGSLTQGHRNRLLREFREGGIRILVTTDLLARGLDVPSVELVVNYELPPQSEDFLHRIGRTARVGRPGTAVTFVTPLDGRAYKSLREHLEGAEEIALVSDFKFQKQGTRSAPRLKSLKAQNYKAGAAKRTAEEKPKKKKKKYGPSAKKKKSAAS